MRLSAGRLDRPFAALAGFLSWWGGELRALVPAALRRQRQGGARLHLDGDGGWPPLGVERSAAPLTILLPEAWIWRKRLRLPVAASDSLRDVLRYEMDRETPFTADQVRYDVSLAKREGAEIMVEVTLVPRRLADPALAALRESGIAIARLATVGAESLQLLDDEERLQGGNGQRGWQLAGALGLAALIVLPLADSWQDDQLTARLDAARQQAAAAARIENRLSGAAASSDPLRQRRAQTPTASEILARLSEALPDGTHLDQARLIGREVQLLGWSATADELPARLEKTGPFRDVRFLSAVVRDAGRGKERFSIGLQLLTGEGGK